MADVNTHTESKDLLPLASRLSRRERAAVYLALGEVSTRAARAVGVDSSTVRRWRQRPDFRGDVDKIRLRLLGTHALRLADGPSRAREDEQAGGVR